MLRMVLCTVRRCSYNSYCIYQLSMQTSAGVLYSRRLLCTVVNTEYVHYCTVCTFRSTIIVPGTGTGRSVTFKSARGAPKRFAKLLGPFWGVVCDARCTLLWRKCKHFKISLLSWKTISKRTLQNQKPRHKAFQKSRQRLWWVMACDSWQETLSALLPTVFRRNQCFKCAKIDWQIPAGRK